MVCVNRKNNIIFYIQEVYGNCWCCNGRIEHPVSAHDFGHWFLKQVWKCPAWVVINLGLFLRQYIQPVPNGTTLESIWRSLPPPLRASPVDIRVTETVYVRPWRSGWRWAILLHLGGHWLMLSVLWEWLHWEGNWPNYTALNSRPQKVFTLQKENSLLTVNSCYYRARKVFIGS